MFHCQTMLVLSPVYWLNRVSQVSLCIQHRKLTASDIQQALRRITNFERYIWAQCTFQALIYLLSKTLLSFFSLHQILMTFPIHTILPSQKIRLQDSHSLITPYSYTAVLLFLPYSRIKPETNRSVRLQFKHRIELTLLSGKSFYLRRTAFCK